MVPDYPLSAARMSLSSASLLGREAVADEALLVLVASWLGFLRGGVAGLGLAAGANPSLSSSSLSSSKLNVGWRWRLWTVAKLSASSSRSKRFSGFLFAARFAFFLPISFRSKALFHQDAFSSSSVSSSSFCSWGVVIVSVSWTHLQSSISDTSVASQVSASNSFTNFLGRAAIVVR